MTSQRLYLKMREQRVLYSVTLELTYRCNLDCFFCYNDRAKDGKPLSLEQYERLLEELADMGTLHLTLTGGEPTVHPDFFAIGDKARQLGFVTRVRTNGHILTAKLSERIKRVLDPFVVEMSLHGASADAHDRQTRVAGSFDRLIAIHRQPGRHVFDVDPQHVRPRVVARVVVRHGDAGKGEADP